MRITFDNAKRDRTLRERGLDLADAAQVFAGISFSDPDTRFDYGEVRQVTLGMLHGEIVVVVWTERDRGRRIISMRKANVYERRRYQKYLGGS